MFFYFVVISLEFERVSFALEVQSLRAEALCRRAVPGRESGRFREIYPAPVTCTLVVL